MNAKIYKKVTWAVERVINVKSRMRLRDSHSLTIVACIIHAALREDQPIIAKFWRQLKFLRTYVVK